MKATQNLNSVIPAVTTFHSACRVENCLLLVKAGIQRFYPSMLSGFVPALRGSFLFDWIPACTKSRQSTDETTSHFTKLSKNDNQVAGYVQQAGRGIVTAGMTNCISVVNVGWHIDEF